MKTKMYCRQCAFGNLYQGPKPKFCQNCGSSLSMEAGADTGGEVAPKTYTMPEGYSVDQGGSNADNADNDENLKNIILDALEVEIDNTDWQTHSVKMGSAVGTRDSAPKLAPKKRGRGRPPKHDRERFLKEFQKEAGSKRPNKTEE